jgi:hypothetical protein
MATYGFAPGNDDGPKGGTGEVAALRNLYPNWGRAACDGTIRL